MWHEVFLFAGLFAVFLVVVLVVLVCLAPLHCRSCGRRLVKDQTGQYDPLTGRPIRDWRCAMCDLGEWE